MQICSRTIVILLCGCLIASVASALAEISTPATNPAGKVRTFEAKGVIQELPPNGRTVVIRHEAISNYMASMTMPFKVRDAFLLQGAQTGDLITFRLNVTADESWVDEIRKIGTAPVAKGILRSPDLPVPANTESFLNYALTNELGKKVCLNDFHGQALAITFFYTRCPLPEFCPRLSRNFQEAAQKLRDLPGAPANWHLLSISFDPAFDTPEMLRAYANSYQYSPDHWSFLTGSPETIRELAQISGVTYTEEAGAINHNFRTLIVDASGRLQMVFPIGGNLSDAIVAQIIQAAAVTNQPPASAQIR